MKKWLYLYRGVSKKYFHLYLKEIEFRFNSRENDIFYEFSIVIKICYNYLGIKILYEVV